MMLRIFAILALLTTTAYADQPQPLSGQVYIDDGDTWFYGWGKRIRIRPAGIDAPEKSQACEKDGKIWFAGIEATKWLVEFLHGRTVTCVPNGEKTFGRLVANCTVDGDDLQDLIVRNGWAFDYTKYSNGRFAAAEAEARKAKRGVHAGRCDKPWEWRTRQRREVDLNSLSSPAMIAQKCCKICRKGKACGDGCIRGTFTCRKPPGCACDGQ